MKRALVIVLFVIVYGAAYAEAPPKEQEPATKLEQFYSKKGHLIIRDFYDLDTIPGATGGKAELQALCIYEPGKPDKVKGMKIEVTEGDRMAKSNHAFLDYDEMISLVKALEYIMQTSRQWQGEQREYSEMIFSTKGNFSIGMYQQAGQPQRFFIEIGYVYKVHYFTGLTEDIDQMKKAVQKGIMLLDKK